MRTLRNYLDYIVKRSRAHHSWLTCVIPYSVIIFLSTGCSLDRFLSTSDPIDRNQLDIDAISNRESAIGLNASAVLSSSLMLSEASKTVGLFTDELTVTPSNSNTDFVSFDSRKGSLLTRDVFAGLFYRYTHETRIRAGLASEMLMKFAGSRDSALIGEAFAIQGYSILMLAENFCSGIPLSKLKSTGGFEYSKGLSTDELFERALLLFDSSIIFAKDSAIILNLARIGKGRTLMNLGRYNDAKEAVKDVPTLFQYQHRYSSQSNGSPFWVTVGMSTVEVENFEGGNGVQWIPSPPAARDPRVPISSLAPFRQQKFPNPNAIFALAKGIEARMIESEALLQQSASNSSQDWLLPINEARLTVGLNPLVDPGAEASRIDLLFTERAYWFYLEAHRLGDFRRLIKQYNRHPLQVYPSGVYTRDSWITNNYFDKYVLSPDDSEKQRNEKYSGCDHYEP